MIDSCFWEISTFSLSVGLSYYLSNGKNMAYVGSGLEYNRSEGLSHGEFTKGYPAYLKGDALRKGKGIGLFFNFGFLKPITGNISFNVAWIVRYSLAKEYEWNLPSWAVLDKPINYSFTGVYLKVGLTHVLLKQKTKQEGK